MVKSKVIRFPVDPRDVPAEKAARRLHLTTVEFLDQLPALIARGFPAADDTTGMYDLKAIDEWMDNRRASTGKPLLQDARTSRKDRLAKLAATAA